MSTRKYIWCVRNGGVYTMAELYILRHKTSVYSRVNNQR